MNPDPLVSGSRPVRSSRRIRKIRLVVVLVVLLVAGAASYLLFPGRSPRHPNLQMPSLSAPTQATLPAVPNGGMFFTPASIPANCSRDVTAALNRWIASVPDDSTLEFPPKACYEIEGTLFVNNRHRLLFNGNGAEFLAKTIGVGTTPPPSPGPQLGWPAARAQWWVMEGADITIENMVIHGAANLEAPYEGTTWGTRKQRRQYIGQYGVRFAGTTRGLLDDCTITDTFSDLVGVTANNPANVKDPQPARDITIVDNVLERSDRDGPSVYDGVDITIAHNTIGDVWGPIVDLEPVATRWEVDDVTVLDNTAGTHAHYFMTASGASTINDNLLFKGNVDIGGNMMMLIGSRQPHPPIRENVQIIDNRADRKSSLKMPLITIRGIFGVIVSGNQAPVAHGAGVLLDYSSHLSISRNRFPGATRPKTGN
jgi:hypothetical protein